MTPSSKVTWLYRHLYEGPYLTLIHSQAQFNVIMRKMNVKKGNIETFCDPNAGATCHTYYSPKGRLCCIVAVNLKRIKDCDPVEICGILVHEAVHVWQAIRREMTGRANMQLTDGIGIETEAYFIQAISQRLIQAYSEQYFTSPSKTAKGPKPNRGNP